MTVGIYGITVVKSCSEREKEENKKIKKRLYSSSGNSKYLYFVVFNKVLPP